jgi:hypothetical protein
VPQNCVFVLSKRYWLKTLIIANLIATNQVASIDFAVRLAGGSRLRAGASPFEVQQMLLHSSLDMTRLYTQFAEEEEIAIRGGETSVLDMLLKDEDLGHTDKNDGTGEDGNSSTADES